MTDRAPCRSLHPFWMVTLLIGCFAMPFAVAFSSWELAMLSPGRWKVADWHSLVASSFLLAGLLCAVVVWQTRIAFPAKVALTVIVLALFIAFAFFSSLRSRCGDEAIYIGERLLKEARTPSCQ